MRIAAAAAFLTIASPGIAAPQTPYSWECKFNSAQICTEFGCSASNQPRDRAIWVLLYPSGGNYYRCVGEGLTNCDRYQASISDSGTFKIFDLPGRGAFIKVADDLTATEVVTVMENVLIKRGKCEEGPPLVRSN